jgi:uncharacterized protein YecE (DUF72 family)
MIKIGCCGFPTRREIYYQSFDVVEIQQTFYQPPKADTLKRWRDEVLTASSSHLKPGKS